MVVVGERGAFSPPKTGALAIGGTVTGIMATGKRSDFDVANDGSDPDKAEELKSDGETLNLITDAMFAGAIAGGVVTTILYFTRPEVKKKIGVRCQRT